MNAARTTFDVDAVAFDLDGTLLDTIHDLSAAVNVLLAGIAAPPLPKSRVRDLVGKGIANLVRRAVAEARGFAPDDAELTTLLARYQAIYEDLLGRETIVFDGVVEGLARLRGAGLRLAVVTNKASRFVAPHLAKAGIARYFETTVGGDDAMAKKPHAAPLLLVAERFGILPGRILVVGDSGNDVDAARAAGSPVLVVPYGYNEGRPVITLASDGIVDSLVDVASMVRRAREPDPRSLPA